MNLKKLPAIVAALVIASCGSGNEDITENKEKKSGVGVVNVYSSRHYDSDRVMYDAFEAETGIKVRLRESKGTALLETMKVEGESSPADMVITSDAGSLYRFQSAGLLQPLHSTVLEKSVPEKFREPEGYWFGLAKRARVIVYDPSRLSADQVDEYTDLSDSALAGEVCQRSSSNIYNLSLMADMIERLGAEAAETTAEAIVSNFARPPKGGDSAQIQSVAAGECSAAFTNHYYWVRMNQSASAKNREATDKTALSFPEQAAGGTHVNITGAGLAAHAPNRGNAVKLMEWLATQKGQSMLVTETKEFPIVEGVPHPDGLEVLPEFIESEMSLSVFGARQSEAQKIYDRVGWN